MGEAQSFPEIRDTGRSVVSACWHPACRGVPVRRNPDGCKGLTPNSAGGEGERRLFSVAAGRSKGPQHVTRRPLGRHVAPGSEGEALGLF